MDSYWIITDARLAGDHYGFGLCFTDGVAFTEDPEKADFFSDRPGYTVIKAHAESLPVPESAADYLRYWFRRHGYQEINE